MTAWTHAAWSVLLSMAWIALAGCERGPWVYETHGETMGTTYTVKAVFDTPESRAQQAALSQRIDAEISRELDRTNQAMSTYIPDSELSQLNAAPENVAIAVSPELFEVLHMAQLVSAHTAGAFDVTVAPLVDAWGFGPIPAEDTPPSPERLETLSESVGYEKLYLDPVARTATKTAPSMRIDLSAIAKGYGVDRVAFALEGIGCSNYMVEVGGEVHAAGRNREGIPWRIGIEQPTPEGRGVRRIVPLDNCSMATSGDYRNFREVDGARFSHTIDPRTARPIAHGLASVTVLHEQCALADAYATGLNVLGPEEGLATAERLRLPVYFIVHTGDGAFEERTTAQFPAAANPQE